LTFVVDGSNLRLSNANDDVVEMVVVVGWNKWCVKEEIWQGSPVLAMKSILREKFGCNP
jgi:hypothetical protein